MPWTNIQLSIRDGGYHVRAIRHDKGRPDRVYETDCGYEVKLSPSENLNPVAWALRALRQEDDRPERQAIAIALAEELHRIDP
ncbi:MAG TPA: hypothetical protein VMY35_02785 [Phycisphaerae bacterium]|nr:hypothetical protein [Phycisphaerae bacterium]